MTRVAVIGAGHWGRNLIKTFYEWGELAAIVESDVTNYKNAPEELLAQKDVFVEKPLN